MEASRYNKKAVEHSRKWNLDEIERTITQIQKSVPSKSNDYKWVMLVEGGKKEEMMIKKLLAKAKSVSKQTRIDHDTDKVLSNPPNLLGA